MRCPSLRFVGETFIPMAKLAKRTNKRVEVPSTALMASIEIAPKLSDPEIARARVDEWLTEIASTKSGKAIERFIAKPGDGKLGDIVAAIGEASPYLWDLIRADPDRFLALLETDPDARFAVLIEEVQRAASAKCRSCSAKR